MGRANTMVFPGLSRAASGLAVFLAILASASMVGGEPVRKYDGKRVIGATARLVEETTGIEFAARIDTGAKTCSLHVDEIEIEDESEKRLKNVGKTIRFLINNGEGQKEWVEAKIASAVRVKSSALKEGVYDRRYKVRLKLTWGDFTKEVLVTLNDRTNMEYPLLIGRNFLRGDFVVDVEQEGDGTSSDTAGS